MFKFSIFVIFFFFNCAIFPDGAYAKNILVWGALSSKSIQLSMTPYLESLAANGHNLTYVTAVDQSTIKLNNVNVVVPKIWKETWDTIFSGELNLYEIRKAPLSTPLAWYGFRQLGWLSCEMLYSDPEFLDWVRASPKYDLVIVELSMLNECGYGMAALWKSKLIGYSTMSVQPGFFDPFGLPDESSSINDILFGTPSGKEMSFGHRVIAALCPIIFNLIREYDYFHMLEEVTRNGWKSLGKKAHDVPSFKEIEKNASLLLVTTHYSLDFPRSFPPNVIQIGGSVITEQKKQLPQEIKKFLDSASHGFIYISFGTLADFTTFDKSVQIAFIKALEQFPDVKFLWSSPKQIEVLPIPRNVLVVNWAPQQAVLAHPRIKAVIIHSGMGATVESVHYGIPMICLPVLAEQDHNAHFISSRGAGIRLEIIDLKQEDLQNAISEILKNDRYKQTVTRLSKIYKDRPSQPIQDAVWWTEYVLRHDNVHEFLASPSVHQPWWKRRQIDIWLTAALLLVAVITIPIYIACRLLKRLIFGGSTAGPKAQSKLKMN